MGNIYVTDMTHFEGIPLGPEYAPARRISQFFGSIVSAASVSLGDKQIEAALFCRRRPNRIPCPGHIQIRRNSASGPINWHCSQCEDQGEISNWEGTSWDLSQQEPIYFDDQKLLELVLTRDEIHELRDSPSLSRKYKNLLYHAILVHGDIVVRTTLIKLDGLQQEIAFDMSVEEKRSRHSVLAGLYERMDIFLEREDDQDPSLLDKINIESNARLKELGFHCQSCGNCCLGLGFELTLDHHETRRWRNFGEVVPSNYGSYYPANFISIIAETDCADLWFHPETGEELTRCPFLRKAQSQSQYRCLIYDIPKLRPGAGKRFPLKDGKVMEEMIKVCPELKRIKQKDQK